MSTFITRLGTARGTGRGVRLAVKDCIDVAGVPTTVGCRAVADEALPAAADAGCLAGARAAGVHIVGKANLHELCFGSTGVNPWFGTPTNPLDPDRVPGGSSSGSAVAVATGESDVAYGSDTTGSVRTPAAYCGVVGLRTTKGRIPLRGVAPLAPSFDVVGPMARDVAGVIEGMALLEPGFVVAETGPHVVGRIRAGDVDPHIEDAVDLALAAAELEVVELYVPSWQGAAEAGGTILFAEAWAELSHIYLRAPEGIGEEVRGRFERGRTISDAAVVAARQTQVAWRVEVAGLFDRVEALALPTCATFPRRIESRDPAPNHLAIPASLAGLPALAQPVPATGRLPASLQLVGQPGGEADLLALGLQVESAVASQATS